MGLRLSPFERAIKEACETKLGRRIRNDEFSEWRINEPPTSVLRSEELVEVRAEGLKVFAAIVKPVKAKPRGKRGAK